MKMWSPKAIKIHEKRVLGHPWVDFLGPWVDFGRARQIIDFLIGLGAVKNEKNRAKGRQRSARGGTGKTQGSDSGAEGSLGRPRAGYSKIVKTL